jgi:sulfur carrier protein
MKIQLNGEEYELRDGLTLAELLDSRGYSQRRLAVEVNREIVPRSLHSSRTLRPGDCVEIVQAMGGG